MCGAGGCRAEEAGNQSFRLQARRLPTRLPLPVPAPVALLPQPLNLRVFLIDGGEKKSKAAV